MVSSHHSWLQILGRLRAFVSRHGLVAVVVGAAALAGCGQKGPLFLPAPPKVSNAAALPSGDPGAPAAGVIPAPPASAAR
ncbi:LPS translocon maturation chaperone LptM [Polaromonas sp. JS666]|uniref:LPS translocon maturation chaperone LptM n=1 Tax=Polaromonas sp. (strain JS666 / ATCC BAA-500) TaxID=296591 RepID=UPI0009D6CC16